MINSAGREVLSKKAVKLTNGDLTLDVSKLAVGIYQVVLNDRKTSRTVSISKQ